MRLGIAFFFISISLWAERCDVPPALAGLNRQQIKQRLASSPDDFTLNRLFLDSSVYQRQPERDRYADLLSRHPDSLDYQYLRARSLVGSNTPGAIRLYAEILAKDPDYPWVHLSQLEVFRSSAFRDRRKLEASFESLTRVCPSSFAPYRWMGEISDEKEMARAATRLRAMLNDAKEDRDLVRYSVLWAAEFRVRPKSEEADEKRQITSDLQKLLPLEKFPSIRGVIQNGAKLTGDTAVEQRMAAARPPDPYVLHNAWQKEHPHPWKDAPPEEKRVYAEARLEESAKLLEIAPDNEMGYSERFEALVMVGAEDAEIVRAADEFLTVFRKNEWSSSNMDVLVPRAFVESGAHLDRVPRLVNEIVARLSKPEIVISIDLAPDRRMAEQRMMLVANRIDALQTLVKAYEKLGKSEEAHETVRRMEDLLASRPLAANETDQEALNWNRNARWWYWQCAGELAEHEGRKLDALAAYREGLVYVASWGGELMAREHRLWKELGGSDEGWNQWLAAIPKPAVTTGAAPVADKPVNRKLPVMSLRDTSGQLWTLDRFQGKTAIAVVWATWCTPCVAELPYFAKLAERLKGRDDVLAISLNTDANVALAETFLKQHEYHFPVLSAKQYAEDLMPYLSIPRTWIIKNGAIVTEHEGFGSDGDKWIEEMLALLKQ